MRSFVDVRMMLFVRLVLCFYSRRVCVARFVGKAEIARTPVAKAFVKEERGRLRSKGAWEEFRHASGTTCETKPKGPESRLSDVCAACDEFSDRCFKTKNISTTL